MCIKDQLNELDQKFAQAEKFFNDMFDKKVIVGETNTVSPTLYGEICRAVNRINYRFYNDGDNMFIGYGNETIGGLGTFLKGNISDSVRMHFVRFETCRGFTCDDLYEKWLKELIIMLAEHMQQNEDKPTEVDATAVESEWDQDTCNHCNDVCDKSALNFDGYCNDCQDEFDEYDDSLDQDDED